MPKYFIITVDTEGEGGWTWKPGDLIKTENAGHIEKFQNLCNKYNFPPVYLTNWEMANEARFIDKATEWEKEKKCEIGIHLHAWSNPPIYPLERVYKSQDYLIEYPEKVMRSKFNELYTLLTVKMGHPPVSHRAGRWIMDERYFKILEDYKIKVDCSITPGINWEKNMGAIGGGSNYTNSNCQSHLIGKILEVPMSIRLMRTWPIGTLKHRIKCLLLGKNIWLRPAGQTNQELVALIKRISKEDQSDYLEFMIHSNELMPNGSPYFKSIEDIDNLYKTMNQIFDYVKNLGYEGCTLNEYYEKKFE